MGKAQHRPNRLRPDLAIVFRTHLLRLEGRKQDHVKRLNEVVGDTSVKVVHKVAHTDEQLVDPLLEMTLPLVMLRLCPLPDQAVKPQQKGKNLVGMKAISIAGGVVHRVMRS